ncbi:putative oxoglutarate/iron-dependent dioxygenase, non-heme dioxygenase domain-containing protein [Helianthus annuus]|nr:putative oxoglutarate/iron-dependent dioxygenase, non-heme dioxygenase domain-containing protein [Helianthus annuus]
MFRTPIEKFLGPPLMASLPRCKLPVIDFSVKNLNPGSDSWTKTCGEVTRALEEYGCFIASYDQVSQELHDAAFVASQAVHNLPVEAKVRNTLDAQGYGFVAQPANMPLYVRLSIENATTAQGVEGFAKLMWPNGNDTFCESVLAFTKALAELEQMVMRMVAKSYGIEKHYERLLGSTTCILKFNKCVNPNQENEKKLGVIPHRDKSFMTVIQQHEEGKGLEVQTKDGEWTQVHLSPSSCIVMAGDACMAWSNGRIEAPYHRVIMQQNKDRYSLVLSSFIKDLKIEVPQELVDKDHPLQFKAFDHYDYIQYVSDTTVEGNRMKGAISSYCGI